MNKIIHSIVTSLLLIVTVVAQNIDPDSGVYDEKYNARFFPYKKGVVKIYHNDIYTIEKYNKKEESLFRKKLDNIVNIISSSKTFNPPFGAEVIIGIEPYYGSLFKKQEPKLYGMIDVRLLAYVEGGVSGKEIVPEDESGTVVFLSVNNPNAVISSVNIIDDIYTRPEKIDKYNGFDIYSSEKTVISFIKRPLFVPVSQEDYLQTAINLFQKDIDDARAKQHAEGAELTGREEFEQGDSERKEELQKAYEELKKYDPAAAEEMKKNLENNLNAGAQNIKNDSYLNTAKTKLIEKNISPTIEKLEQFKKALASLTPSQRKAQAYWHQNAFDFSPTGLASADMEGAEPMVRVNRNFMDPSKPQSDLQVLVLEWRLSESGDELPRNFSGGKVGVQSKDITLVKFSREKEIWRQIINLLSK